MNNALIVYGSTTGNTEFTAETIKEYFEKNDYSVTVLNVTDTGVDELKKEYDLYLLGCSTWGDDEIELQEDFTGFYENLNKGLSLEGKNFAMFGCGDSSYEYFCGAVDMIADKVDALGGTLVFDALKIDGDPEEDEIYEWTRGVINAV
ncbi:flavodoxin [Desulfobacula toluolica]|uniref:Flavodoxin n=1 Tax=Desulfobacula toluolica (strain DSM 7467 / Tol2) TaxID=651182 RepID=K0NN72_DESTT|nr:flavodoxin [Desulfobacula toluolica]CCK81463.1 flavodoxin [Desulfobacula toluolica Tol2]